MTMCFVLQLLLCDIGPIYTYPDTLVNMLAQTIVMHENTDNV